MRALIWITGLLAVLYAGYWVLGKRAVEQAAVAFFVAAPDSGLIAENTGLSVQGFPSRFDLTVSEPRLTHPRNGLQWYAPFLQILSLSYKPWHVIAAFPPSQTLQTPGEALTLTSGKLQASVVVTPNASVALDRIAVVGSDLGLTSDLGWGLTAVEARLATRADTTRTNAYEIGMDVTTLALDATLAALLPDLPGTVEKLHFDALGTLSAPLDRTAGQTRPSLTALSVKAAQVTWGPLIAFAKGDLSVIQGVPEGRIDIRLQGWRALIPVAVRLGAITPEVAPTMERMMEILATSGGDPKVLEMPLVFANGLMSLGPLPLGPAPRLD